MQKPIFNATAIAAATVLCLASSISDAQLRKASDYFPLAIGNIWEYKPNPDVRLDTHIEIVSDTLLGDSLRIYKALLRFPDRPNAPIIYNYYYYNMDSTVVYRDPEFPRIPYDSYTGLPMLDTRHGLMGIWWHQVGDAPAEFAIVDSGTSVYFGQSRHWIDVYAGTFNREDSTWLVSWVWRFVEGIGPVRESSDTLVYAKINGVEYGTRLSIREKHFKPHFPERFRLEVSPNPLFASQQATIRIDLPSTQGIQVEIVNVLGQSVRRLFYGQQLGGLHHFVWDGKDAQGNDVPQGLYFVVLRGQTLLKSRKFIYLK